MKPKTLILLIIATIILIVAIIFRIYVSNIDNESNTDNTKQVTSSISIPEDAVTDDFVINSFTKINGKTTLGCYLENSELGVNLKEFDLPEILYDFRDDVRLRLTYSPENYEVYECQIVNIWTDEIVENTSEENLNKLFNIEYNKNIIEKTLTDTIKLSELEENDIYRYTSTQASEFPLIENDLGKNCIVYINRPDSFSDENYYYEKEIYIANEISSNSVSFSYNEIDKDESFKVMYKEIDSDLLLKLIDKNEIIFLSDNEEKELTYDFEKYIYNDTSEDITIIVNDSSFNVEDTNTYILKSGEIYGFDWMIDSVTIER